MTWIYGMANKDSPETSKDAPEKPEVRFNVTPRVWEYLDWLSRHSVMGKSANDIAERILIQRLAEMRQEDYKPPDKL